MLTRTPRRALALASATHVDLFDYSKEEWSKIEAATQSIRTAAALPDDARAELLRSARVYLARMVHPNPVQHRKWRKVIRQTEGLRHALAAAIELDLRHLGECGLEKELLAENAEYLQRPFEDLSVIQDFAEEMAEMVQRRPPELRHYDVPRMIYEWEILEVWIALGGQLGISRHPRTGKVQGPLARFFRAVTVPVMGASAPALETLRDVIARHERIRLAGTGIV